MKTSAHLVRFCLAAILLGITTANAQTISTLAPLATFGTHGDGSRQPGDETWLDSAFNQRGLAFDPVSKNLILVDTHTGTGGGSAVQGNIYVLDGANGTAVTTLDKTGIAGGSYADAPAGVADDGTVYVANQVTISSNNPVIIYRWDSSTSSIPPLVVFSNTISPTINGTPNAGSERFGVSMDVRGAGTNTQIIMGSYPNGAGSGSFGTNVLIFTTADGTNFTATILRTDAAVSSFNDGIAFGPGDTFFAKRLLQPLRFMAFSVVNSNAVTVKTFPSTTFSDNDNLGPIAVDVTNNLLAAIEVGGGAATGGKDRVRLYDISNFSNQPPVLLDVKNFPVDNQNTVAPEGFLDFGNGNLYVNNVNNGLMAFNVTPGPIPFPSVTVAPLETNKVVTGRSFALTVAAYPAVSYQWLSNNVPILFATNGTYNLVNIQPNFGPTYTCIVSNAGGVTNVSTRIEIVSASSFYHLNLQWTAFHGDGVATHNNSFGVNYMNGGMTLGGTPNQRTVAYNALSNQVVVVSRQSNLTSNYTVAVIDAATGDFLYLLKTNGIQCNVGQGGIGLTAAAVADDGAVYACNETPNANGFTSGVQDSTKMFRVYRWANTDSNTLPVQIYLGDPAVNGGIAGSTSVQRWGDTLAARGSGTNTVLVLDNQNPTVGYVAFLMPTESTLGQPWTQVALHQSTPTGAAIGRSLEFGVGDTVWQKRGQQAYFHFNFDLVNPASFDPIDTFGTLAAVTPAAGGYTNALSGVAFDESRKLMAGFSCYAAAGPDTLDLYEVSKITSPFLLAQYNTPLSGTANSHNFISQTIFRGNKVFAIDAGWGLMAYTVAAGAPTAPAFITQPRNARVMQGGTASFSVTVDQQAAFRWQSGPTFSDISGATNATYNLSNAQPANAGSYRVVASNIFGMSTSSVATLTVIMPADTWSMAPIWSNAPGSQPYLNTSADDATPFQRSLGYSAVANHLYLISRTSASGGLQVNVLDPATGNKLYELNTNGIAVSTDPPRDTDNIVLAMLAVADDGAIYAGNISMANSTAINAEFHLYRWADDGSNTAPVLVYSGEPANASPTALRWGDTMHVRGSGTNTQVIIDNQRSSMSVATVFVPTDSSMTVFTNKPFTHSYGTMFIGRSVQFGTSNTVWQKSYSSALKLSSYDLATQTSTVVSNFNTFPSTLGGLFLDTSRGIAVGVNFTGTLNTTPDQLNLYEISDLNTPVLIGKFNFPTNHQANGNHITHAVFTPNKLFALNANNGLLAFSLAPTLYQASVGQNVVLSWVTNFAGFTLQATPSLSPAVTWTNVSLGSIVGGSYMVTNSTASGDLFYRLKR